VYAIIVIKNSILQAKLQLQKHLATAGSHCIWMQPATSLNTCPQLIRVWTSCR